MLKNEKPVFMAEWARPRILCGPAFDTGEGEMPRATLADADEGKRM